MSYPYYQGNNDYQPPTYQQYSAPPSFTPGNYQANQNMPTQPPSNPFMNQAPTPSYSPSFQPYAPPQQPHSQQPWFSGQQPPSTFSSQPGQYNSPHNPSMSSAQQYGSGSSQAPSFQPQPSTVSYSPQQHPDHSAAPVRPQFQYPASNSANMQPSPQSGYSQSAPYPLNANNPFADSNAHSSSVATSTASFPGTNPQLPSANNYSSPSSVSPSQTAGQPHNPSPLSLNPFDPNYKPPESPLSPVKPMPTPAPNPVPPEAPALLVTSPSATDRLVSSAQAAGTATPSNSPTNASSNPFVAPSSAPPPSFSPTPTPAPAPAPSTTSPPAQNRINPFGAVVMAGQSSSEEGPSAAKPNPFDGEAAPKPPTPMEHLISVVAPIRLQEKQEQTEPRLYSSPAPISAPTPTPASVPSPQEKKKEKVSNSPREKLSSSMDQKPLSSKDSGELQGDAERRVRIAEEKAAAAQERAKAAEDRARTLQERLRNTLLKNTRPPSPTVDYEALLEAANKKIKNLEEIVADLQRQLEEARRAPPPPAVIVSDPSSSAPLSSGAPPPPPPLKGPPPPPPPTQKASSPRQGAPSSILDAISHGAHQLKHAEAPPPSTPASSTTPRSSGHGGPAFGDIAAQAAQKRGGLNHTGIQLT